MKRLRSIFKILAVLSSFLSLSSCWSIYVTKDYSGSECYKIVDDYLQDQGWERTVENDKIVFIKGQSIKLTFSYDSEGLEVQIHLERKEGEDFDVSVGNWGMIGEIHLMESRFERISSKLDEKIKENCQLNKVTLFFH